MIIGCVSLVPYNLNRFIGIKCSKGRGVILPGGKWEEGETYKEAAKRELLEETGLVAETQQLLFHALNTDGAYCYTFVTTINDYKPRDSHEGEGVLCSWDDLFKSKFKAYYELLKETYDARLEAELFQRKIRREIFNVN